MAKTNKASADKKSRKSRARKKSQARKAAGSETPADYINYLLTLCEWQAALLRHLHKLLKKSR